MAEVEGRGVCIYVLVSRHECRRLSALVSVESGTDCATVVDSSSGEQACVGGDWLANLHASHSRHQGHQSASVNPLLTLQACAGPTLATVSLP